MEKRLLAASLNDSDTAAARASLSRRSLLLAGVPLALGLVTGTPGCVNAPGANLVPDLVWGRRGLSDGRLLKPRAMTIDKEDQLYLVDTTGRIQVFTADGEFLRGWKMPLTEFGRPTGLGIDGQQSHLLVADTHYFRVVVFSLSGEPVPNVSLGGTSGRGPGEFAFVTDVVRDSAGVYYVGEYGDNDRIQRFDPAGNFLDSWGSTGRELEQFVRPQCLVLSPDETELWVADACNHRLQVFDITSSPAKLKFHWGTEGPAPGQLYYPYGIALASDGTVFVCEYGNQRVQQFDRQGRSLRVIGGPGHGPGQFYQPWGLAFDSQQRLHVLDSNNHRVQRFLVT